MRTIIEYMQRCHIHLYQKIARKNAARVNAALRSERDGRYLLNNLNPKQQFILTLSRLS